MTDRKIDAVVVIVDTSNNTYYSHRVFETVSEAFAYEDGVNDAWKISYGFYNCCYPFALGAPNQF